MQLEQLRRSSGEWFIPDGSHVPADEVQLVVYFGELDAAVDAQYAFLRGRYPAAHIIGCSTAGEIAGTRVLDNSCVATAVRFAGSRIESAYERISSADESARVGQAVAQRLNHRGLVHVFVLAEGLNINGSELVRGLRRGLPSNVAVTGGLAGDGDRFLSTSVRLNDQALAGGVAIIGFYGSRLRFGYGSMGGWDPFGPERLITRSVGNVLYEFDGTSALDLYKSYLGPHASELPSSGLRFPLSLRSSSEGPGIVRTILGINDDEGSLVFAGEVPQGGYARLMKANIDRLIDGAQGAAVASYSPVGGSSPDLAILISCVGRRLVLRQRVEEEIESVRDHLGEKTLLTGFYSYGEIAPFSASASCELHNQTMTITTISEEI